MYTGYTYNTETHVIKFLCLFYSHTSNTKAA